MIIVTLGSCSSPRTLLVAIACASRDWPSKLCSTRRIGCMLASLQTIKISAPLKFIVDSESTLSKPEVIQYNLHNRSSFTSTIYITSVGNAFHSAIKKYSHHYRCLQCPATQGRLAGQLPVLRIAGTVGRAVSGRMHRAGECIFAFPTFAA
jgi:hypothetical protein